MRLKPLGTRKFLQAVLTLQGIPGVVGVFWGQRKRGERWTREPCLCVHVQWKRPRSQIPADELFPKQLNGFPIDVLDVGQPLLFSADRVLDHTDEIMAPGLGNPRNGTITALAYTPAGTMALLSGHVALPLEQGTILRDFQTAGQPGLVRFIDPVATDIPGYVQRGQFSNGRAVDWALVSIPDIDYSELMTKHYAAGTGTPLPVCTTPLEAEALVYHYSRLQPRRRLFRGRIRQVTVGELGFTAPDGTQATYSEVIVISSPAEHPFSLPGDSGSLVVDGNERVIGSVIGGTQDGTTSYVAPIQALLPCLGPIGRYFFA
jgi:hypothetical protein